MDVTFDPCSPVVVEAGESATPAERESLRAGIAMWNDIAGTALLTEAPAGVPRLPVLFERAAPAFHGIYDDEVGEILINRELGDHHGRAVTIAHEVGHAFGLWHVEASQRTSVMNAGNIVVEPTMEDVDRLTDTWGRCVDVAAE